MINLDSRTKSKLVWVATVLAPVLVVQGVRFAIGHTGPADAAAATTASQPDAAAQAVEAEKPLSAQQKAAQAWLATRQTSSLARSPMDRPDVDEPSPETPTTSRTPVARASTPDEPASKPIAETSPEQLVLRGMIVGGSEHRGLASINHRIYRVGDQVTPHWVVASIDSRKRTVSLTGPEGRVVNLSTPSPDPDR